MVYRLSKNIIKKVDKTGYSGVYNRVKRDIKYQAQISYKNKK